MSGIRRHLLGWDEPLCRKVCGFLFPQGVPASPDFESTLIVVPTRQAGRRLREAIALCCAHSDRNTPVLGLRVMPPTFFLHAPGPVPEASPSLVKTLWTRVLLRAEPADLTGLFPTGIPSRDTVWAVRVGESIQSLRESLAEGGCSIDDALARHGEKIEEIDRWRDLARLEAAYLEALAGVGQEDPCARKIRLSSEPQRPEGVQRILVAAVPDPTLLLTRALERLATEVDVEILVYAPPVLDDAFDFWGRPLPARWAQALIDVPDPAADILLAASPADQSRKALETMAAGIGSIALGPADTGIGVPDRTVVPFLQADLAERGIEAFDPAGKRVMDTLLGRLLVLLRDLRGEDSFPAFAALVRHPDILHYLDQAKRLPPFEVLSELDRYQQNRLPTIWRCADAPLATPDRPCDFPRLSAAVAGLVAPLFSDEPLPAALRGMLAELYRHRTISSVRPEDREFADIATAVDAALHEIQDALDVESVADGAAAFDLLLRRLEDETYEPDRPAEAVDLEGWLELPWNDAALLVVTGMNEGFVPDTRINDIFLPDRLRRELGLRDDTARFARDVYLAQSLLGWRAASRAAGRVVFVAGRAGAEGDPLKPSRLLFRCPDRDLVERAAILFAEPREKRETVPLTIGLRLNPAPPPDLPAGRVPVTSLRVTAFRQYLACPFRFYLRHILGMESLDPGKSQMDDLDFGILVHDALRDMAHDAEMRGCRDRAVLSAFLRRRVESAAHRKYGAVLPLLIRLQVEAAQQRLAAAAGQQVRLAEEGWEILHHEIACEIQLGGLCVTGTVDRIDRHRASGRLRILDYKTSDTAQSAGEAHLGGVRADTRDYAKTAVAAARRGGSRVKVWTDLQLPLYRLMVLARPEFAGVPCDVGYFNLPKALADTGVEVWNEFTDELAATAETCAAGVIADIRAQRFWPPSERVKNDDFESLFPAAAEECFDVAGFFGASHSSVAKSLPGPEPSRRPHAGDDGEKGAS